MAKKGQQLLPTLTLPTSVYILFCHFTKGETETQRDAGVAPLPRARIQAF